MGLLRSCFARTQTWLQAGKYVSALASELPSRNGWSIAEHAGDRTPDQVAAAAEPGVVGRDGGDEPGQEVRGGRAGPGGPPAAAQADDGRGAGRDGPGEAGQCHAGRQAPVHGLRRAGSPTGSTRCCATRRSVVSLAQRGEIGGKSLGLMAYLDPKGEGENSMPENRRSCPGVWDGVPGDPRDMAKAGLPESQSPEGAIRSPAGKTPETGAAPAAG